MTPERLRALVFELPDVAEEAHPYGTFYRVRGHLIAKVPGVPGPPASSSARRRRGRGSAWTPG
jgi:hypothetical protein